MAVLCTWVPEGGLLGVVAPLALAAAQRTALVLDLDPEGPRYPGEGSLARLASAGPRRADLIPDRSGVAVLRNGGVDYDAGREVVEAFAERWPSVVLRLPACRRPDVPFAIVPVLALVPGDLAERSERVAVWQRCGWRAKAPGPGPVLPRPRKSTVHALLSGRRPARDRWVRSWRKVWETPWT
jgi:hypothetical protein